MTKRPTDPHTIRMGDLAADGRTYRHQQSLKRLLLGIAKVKPPENDHITNLHAAEVGVFLGATSEFLLRNVPELHLTMVDPWREAEPDSTYAASRDGVSRLSQSQLDDAAKLAAKRTEGMRRVILRMTSVEAAAAVPSWFDLVFIDAEHTYEGVSVDIRAWWPKVLEGGILCGHDWKHPKFPGVNQAVEEFAAREGVAIEGMPGRVWVAKKP